MITLPTEKVKAKSINPKFLILFGKPKAGKTTLVAALKNNLIIDLEGGSEFLDAMAIQARNIQDLGEIAQAIREKNKSVNGYFYQHITIDNATRLEEMTLAYALQLYQKTPMGKGFTGDLRTLPQGGGWFYIRQAVRKVLDMFRELCPEFILVGHTKEKIINLEGEELSEMQLDLAGKLSDIVCGEADAIGYVYRKKNETRVSFKGGDSTIREARALHLRGNNITLADSDESNNVTVYWDRIYLPEN